MLFLRYLLVVTTRSGNRRSAPENMTLVIHTINIPLPDNVVARRISSSNMVVTWDTVSDIQVRKSIARVVVDFSKVLFN